MVENNGTSLKLNLKREVDESYEIIFGKDLFPQIARYLKDNSKSSNYAIITDSNVRNPHALDLQEIMVREGLNTKVFWFPAGEQNKTIDRCTDIMNKMSREGFGRDSYVIALGGGVTGDMSGFMASIFNRGVPYIQVPTSVLAQADSAVGGKTGVDTDYGKNLVGAFKQPQRVFVDVNTLRTLPQEEFVNGLAETIKHGIIKDEYFFSFLDNNLIKILQRDEDSLLYIANQNCRIKGEVVELDPHEKGLRRILNYGHTAGHAIEKISNFTLSHGQCVSMGMMVAGRIANILGYFPKEDLGRQKDLLERAGLSVFIPDEIKDEDIIALTSLDKKAKAGVARYCLPDRIGQMNKFGGVYANGVPEHIVLEALRKTR